MILDFPVIGDIVQRRIGGRPAGLRFLVVDLGPGLPPGDVRCAYLNPYRGALPAKRVLECTLPVVELERLRGPSR